MNVSVKWVVPPSKLQSNVERLYLDRIQLAIDEIAAFIAVKMQDEAKTHAKWIDRTGRARAGLQAFTDRVSRDLVIIYLTTQAPYGKWLELANGARFAIIKPTILNNLTVINSMLDNLFK